MATYRDPMLKLFSASGNLPLAEAIADHIGCSLGACEVSTFSDGEIWVRIDESVRGCDVFVIQPTSAPVNDNLMQLLIMEDALKRASAARINVVMPYYGYARQDRKARARDPITAKLTANLIETAGADRMIAMDLHAGQIQGFFNIPVDHLMAAPILAEYFLSKHLPNPVVVSPDMGGVARARDLAERLGAPIAIVDKRRPAPNVAEVMHVVGEIEGRTAIMVDDIIDTAGTICEGAKALIENGARKVYACCTHPVLSGPAIRRLQEAPIEEVVVTDTIFLPPQRRIDKIQVLSVAALIGDAIVRVHENASVSHLFEG